MAWRRPGGKPLSELMVVSLLTEICVTQPQWVNQRDPLWIQNYSLAVAVSYTDYKSTLIWITTSYILKCRMRSISELFRRIRLTNYISNDMWLHLKWPCTVDHAMSHHSEQTLIKIYTPYGFTEPWWLLLKDSVWVSTILKLNWDWFYQKYNWL